MSFFSRIFSKGPAPGPVDQESWQPGDMAESITRHWWLNGTVPADGPIQGEVQQVAAVKVIRPEGSPPILFLAFRGHTEWYSATGFRKVLPRADEAIAAEAEFVELVRRSPAPARLPAPTPEKIEELQ